jgi:hypothetical protein
MIIPSLSSACRVILRQLNTDSTACKHAKPRLAPAEAALAAACRVKKAQVNSKRCRSFHSGGLFPSNGRRGDMSEKADKIDLFRDRRNRRRASDLTNPMAAIRSSGGPLYQFKVSGLSEEGAGVVVRPDSNFLQTIEVGQEMEVRLVLPRDTAFKGPSGNMRSKVIHITAITEGPFKGHVVIGLSFLPVSNPV